MSKQSFSLKPFPASKNAQAPLDLQITGSIDRHNNTLSIAYELSGKLSKVQIAPPSNTPARKHDLWQETCFEFFLGIKNSPVYWEFNLSPAGHWNVYRFDDYRHGMREETAFMSLRFTFRPSKPCCRCILIAVWMRSSQWAKIWTSPSQQLSSRTTVR